MPVVDTHVARQAGVVSDVLLDLQAGRVAVLNVKHADGWLVQRIPAEYIYRLGPAHRARGRYRGRRSGAGGDRPALVPDRVSRRA